MQKYTLSDIAPDEQQAFLKEFQSFLDDKGLYFEPVPTFQRKDLESPWEIKVSILLQKKTPIEVSDESAEEELVPSPADESVNPNA